MALAASKQELAGLPEVEQLQVMFFRSMIKVGELTEMTAQQLIAYLYL